MKKLTEITASNRDAWDASAAAFEDRAEWHDMIRSLKEGGFSTFDQTMTQTLQDIGIAGRRAVQIGCNNGRELLSLPSLGAIPVLGIDVSEAFLAQARTLADLAGSECQFLCSDIYDLPDDMPGDFELGLITIGVLNWMPDLVRFFEIVAGLLSANASLVIYESHPVMEMFDPDAKDPFNPFRSYFDKTPMTWSETITYDGTPGKPGPTSYWFTHGLGEIVTACSKAGLVIERLSEYAHSNREVDYDIYEGRTAQIPMSFTLVARKSP
ncbi:bifunctional 2-polyprenyl-6-hydroxyphenol methylase/3-demethylubiquinol 3-O-methyltransferase UbiG [uncultured Roseovarius sp.]|uniref:class I SAM-dependent methyltransferase n=1 Tax=uncultured Roseovarius sp. TaxID=293344 RepID=UPI0026076D91|nr:class I SAM-dependent methyltransferase [uncultured Roseovarius sp.]